MRWLADEKGGHGASRNLTEKMARIFSPTISRVSNLGSGEFLSKFLLLIFLAKLRKRRRRQIERDRRSLPWNRGRESYLWARPTSRFRSQLLPCQTLLSARLAGSNIGLPSPLCLNWPCYVSRIVACLLIPTSTTRSRYVPDLSCRNSQLAKLVFLQNVISPL